MCSYHYMAFVWPLYRRKLKHFLKESKENYFYIDNIIFCKKQFNQVIILQIITI